MGLAWKDFRVGECFEMVDYANAKLNLVRQNDRKLFGGWATWIATGKVEATVPEVADLKPGDRIIGQLQGLKRQAEFAGRVANIDRQTLFLELSSPFTERRTELDSRVKIDNFHGRIRTEGRAIDFTATDMSSRGLGVAVAHPLRPNSTVEVTVSVDSEAFRFDAEVRHCRQDICGNYRAGLFMANFNQAEQLKWKRCLVASLQLR